MTQYIYSMFNKFFGFNDTKDIHGSKEYTTLPSKKKTVITQDNIGNFTRLGIPQSMIAAKIAGARFIDSVDGIEPCFADIETTSDLKFVTGFVGKKQFDDSKEMMEELKKHDLIVFFNGFRFDLDLLMKWHPEDFYYQTINKFKVPILPRKLVLDLYYFFRLWRPYNSTHSMTQLAKDTEFEDERLDHKDKTERCRQDKKIMEHAYKIIPPIFKTLSGIVNMDWYFLQNSYYTKLRKFAIFQYYIDNGMIPTEYPDTHNVRKAPKPSLFFKRGMFTDTFMYDISNAYPSTAKNLNLTLYTNGDFTEIQKKILSLKGDKTTDKTIKYICNSMIGDMRDRNNYIRSEKIWQKVLDTCSKKMNGWILSNKGKVIFSHTDSLVLTEEKKPKVWKYNIDLKHRFKMLVIYNHTRYLGIDKDTGEIVRAGFRKPMRIKLFDYFDGNIDEELRKGNLKMLEDSGGKDGDVFTLIPRLDEMDKSFFAIKIFKKDEVCRNPDYWEIWGSLPIGFSEVFLAEEGYTTDFSEIDFNHYLKMVYPYLRQYVIKDNRRDIKGDKLKG